ncbi:MAG TPA: hypothetical protein VJS42_20925 [Steroidobacteraceae bacterium]|nr:hypothetical protein [Steroidobacteraceae bacterium]
MPIVTLSLVTEQLRQHAAEDTVAEEEIELHDFKVSWQMRGRE